MLFSESILSVYFVCLIWIYNEAAWNESSKDVPFSQTILILFRPFFKSNVHCCSVAGAASETVDFGAALSCSANRTLASPGGTKISFALPSVTCSV